MSDLISRQAVKTLVDELARAIRYERYFIPKGRSTETIMQDILDLPSVEPEKCGDVGEISDGYHTFNQLYHQRAILFAAIVNQNKDVSWKSYKHSDGKYCFDSDGEWFVVGIDTPKGSYTYHYSKKYWNYFDCIELERGKEWDGHTEDDVIRLLSLSSVEPERKTGIWTHEDAGVWICGVCGEEVGEMGNEYGVPKYNFCPYCGADMTGRRRTERNSERQDQEAIKIIKSECYISDLLDLDRTRMVNTALDVAIEALKQEPKWIPVSERLPKVGEKVLCQCQANIYDVLKLTIDGWYHDENHCYMWGFVIAWMPLPEPYREDDIWREDNYDEDEELVESLLNDFEGTLERIDKQDN